MTSLLSLVGEPVAVVEIDRREAAELCTLYRFDGWTRVRTVKRAAPGRGSTWAKGSATDAIGSGEKTLWVYHYEQEAGR